MPALFRVLSVMSVLLLLADVSTSGAQKPKLKPVRASVKAAVQPPASEERAKLEAALSKKLTNATLVGSFTVDGKNAGKPPRMERYELGTVKKLKNDYWLFVAKIKYGKKNYSLPIPISVKIFWAGDTPVVTLTNLTIPTMGTFTARVLFYGDRYVGTWQHGKAGGHMFGKIEPAKKKSKDTKKAK